MMTQTDIPQPLADQMRLDAKAVCTLCGFGRTKLYELVAAGRFPSPLLDGPRFTRWRAADVRAYLEAQR